MSPVDMIAIIAAGAAFCTSVGGTWYIVWDIKRFQTQARKELEEFKMRLDNQAKIHTSSLHNPSGSLIYVTDAACRDRMASCPAGRAISCFGELEKKLDDMGDKLASTRECFIEAVSNIRATVELLMQQGKR